MSLWIKSYGVTTQITNFYLVLLKVKVFVNYQCIYSRYEMLYQNFPGSKSWPMQHDFVYEKNVKYLKRWADNFFRLVIRWAIFHFLCTFLNRVKSLKMFRNPLSIFISFGNQLRGTQRQFSGKYLFGRRFEN